MAGISFSAKATLKIDKFQLAKEFRSMTRQELAKECRRYFDMANKRINRLEQSGVLSPALHAVNSSGGKFYAKGADLHQLQHEYARCINFLNMGTSTVTAARKYENNLAEKLGGHKLTDKQRRFLFTAFREIRKVSPAGIMNYGSDRLIQYLADEIDSEDENIMQGVNSQDWDAMLEKVVNDAVEEVRKIGADIVRAFNERFRDIFSL